MDLHYLFLSGRAVVDAEVMKSKAGKEYAKFRIAINEYNSKTKESTPFYYDAVVFGKTVENVGKQVKKGDKVILHGKPEVSAYMSKKDKEPKGSISVVVDDWKVLK